MTPEERDRLVRVEDTAMHLARDVELLRTTMMGINAKLDTIITTLNLSKGAYRALIVVGSVGATVTTMLGAAVAWAWRTVQ